MTDLVVREEIIRSLRCRHGCKEDICGVFYFPDGCVCLDEQVQALCVYHMRKAASNIQHGAMHRMISFGEWPECRLA